jgi:pimeloyl-ACP methyl ester carboxylesterase
MHIFKLLAVISTAISACSASTSGQATNFDLGAKVAFQHGCNEMCQAILEVTNVADLQVVGTDFDQDFYDTASSFKTSSPGDLLKLEPLDSTLLDIPAGIATFRFQYTSIDIDGSHAPSSGLVMFPFATPEQGNGKFPLVAYAHGTIGLNRGCAPSTSPNLFDYISWSPLLLEGYAVVATDYVGLGTNHTSHKYLSLAAHANDIYYSVVAARKAFPGVFTDKWMSVGHSQGGGAVWKLSEHPLVQNPKSGYIGTVSIAPAVNALDLATTTYDKILPLKDFHDYVVTAEFMFLLKGLTAAYPHYDMPWAAEALKKRLSYAEAAQSCAFATLGLTLDLLRDQLIVSGGANPKNDKTLKKWTLRNAAAQGAPASMPMLVIQGLNDTSILSECTLRAYKNATANGNKVRLLEYPGLDHSATTAASSPAWLGFIRDRFSSHPAAFESSRSTVHPFNLKVAKTPSDLDFLDSGEAESGMLGAVNSTAEGRSGQTPHARTTAGAQALVMY